jgi:putative N6-adenine-specific DNA methylase
LIDKLFAVAAPGLEAITAQELRNLRLAPAQTVAHTVSGTEEESGGVAFEGGLREIYQANLWLRTCSRVLVRLGEFRAVSFPELRKKAGRLAWERFMAPGQPVALRVTCRKSRLYHSDAVAERLAGAIGDHLGIPPPVERPITQDEFPGERSGLPPALIVVRLVHDECTVSLDSSGELLHRRGYRLATAKAPLRETLAVGILLAAGWSPAAALVDPFCGSGTIPIEAALMRMGIAPGRNRRFAFMDWPGFDQALWEELLARGQGRDSSAAGAILASDRDAGAIQAAQENAARAGVGGEIQFACQAVSDAISAIQPGSPVGWVVTNPPYGVRVSADKDLRNLYARFGNLLRENCPNWHVAILCNDEQLLRQTGLRLENGLSLVNGGVSVRLAQGVVARME